jgi:hypothetical protein
MFLNPSAMPIFYPYFLKHTSLFLTKKGDEKRGQATFSDVGIRSYLRECCKDEKQESIFSLWQGLTPIIEAVLFLAEKVACPLFFPFFTQTRNPYDSSFVLSNVI